MGSYQYRTFRSIFVGLFGAAAGALPHPASSPPARIAPAAKMKNLFVNVFNMGASCAGSAWKERKPGGLLQRRQGMADPRRAHGGFPAVGIEIVGGAREGLKID